MAGGCRNPCLSVTQPKSVRRGAVAAPKSDVEKPVFGEPPPLPTGKLHLTILLLRLINEGLVWVDCFDT
jgi:hypothetical protein